MNNFISTINSKINNSRNKEKKEIISANFDWKRKDDCINVDEFLLKIDGPLRILDKEYEKNKNDLLNNEEINHIDPLNPSNFRNGIQNKDLYEKLNSDYDYQLYNPYGLIEPKLMSSNQSQKNNTNVNLIPINDDFNFDNENIDNEIKSEIYSNSNKQYEKENKNSNSNKGSRKNKNKKKNNINMADLISSGQF